MKTKLKEAKHVIKTEQDMQNMKNPKSRFLDTSTHAHTQDMCMQATSMHAHT